MLDGVRGNDRRPVDAEARLAARRVRGDSSSDLEEQLRKLDDLLDQGLITQEDYDREKEELLREY